MLLRKRACLPALVVNGGGDHAEPPSPWTALLAHPLATLTLPDLDAEARALVGAQIATLAALAGVADELRAEGRAASWPSKPTFSYVIYARYITAWDDGTPLSDEEQAELLNEIVDEAARRGWKFEIERA